MCLAPVVTAATSQPTDYRAVYTVYRCIYLQCSCRRAKQSQDQSPLDPVWAIRASDGPHWQFQSGDGAGGILIGTFRSLLSQIRLSSVTFVRPTQCVKTVGNISSLFCTLAILWSACKIVQRLSEGNPSIGWVKRKRGSTIQRCHVRVSYLLSCSVLLAVRFLAEWNSAMWADRWLFYVKVHTGSG